MPCGGIYPVADANPNWQCFYCNEKGCDHFCEEWDCGLHEACVIPFLHTDEGEVVLDHNHEIQIGMFVLQDECGELMDPDETLNEIRELIDKLDVVRSKDESAAGLEDDVCQLIGAIENLDGWLKNGGFPPKDWRKDG